MNGEPWSSFHDEFDTDLAARIAKGTLDDIDDLDVAHALTRLVHEELTSFGTDSQQRLDNDAIAEAQRALRAVLRRLRIAFNPPFSDFTGFHGYWKREGMSGPGGWGERTGYLSRLFEPVWRALNQLEDSGASSAMRGVDGELKNLIFASCGSKPEIVLRDAVNNVIEVVKNGEHCLVYDRPLAEQGLTWGDLVSWWGVSKGSSESRDRSTAVDLFRRLNSSLGDNPAEKRVFQTYCELYRGEQGFDRPALIPQVYLHFDPFTNRERRALGKPDRLARERMDFLLLLPKHVRIVIEVDGQQHYADGDKASPRRYADMITEDRALRLRGYEVYRFGGYELMQPDASAMLRQFFDDLYAAHGGKAGGES